MKDIMDDKSFVTTACAMLLACIACQLMAFHILNTKDKIVPSTESVAKAQSATVDDKMVPDVSEKDSTPAELKRKYRRLKRLENQADFLEFTSKELEIAKLLKSGGKSYTDCLMMIDMGEANPLEKARKYMEKREYYLQKALEQLVNFVKDADFSCLTKEEHATFSKYVDDRRRWAEIIYDDFVDNETKLEACRAWADVWVEIMHIAEKMYRAQYGDAYEKFKAVYDSSEIDSIISYTNPWWINSTSESYRDKDGKQHHLRIKLFDE